MNRPSRNYVVHPEQFGTGETSSRRKVRRSGTGRYRANKGRSRGVELVDFNGTSDVDDDDGGDDDDVGAGGGRFASRSAVSSDDGEIEGGSDDDDDDDDSDEELGFAQAAPDVLREDVEAIILDLKDVIMRHKRANKKISKLVDEERQQKEKAKKKFQDLNRQCVCILSSMDGPWCSMCFSTHAWIVKWCCRRCALLPVHHAALWLLCLPERYENLLAMQQFGGGGALPQQTMKGLSVQTGGKDSAIFQSGYAPVLVFEIACGGEQIDDIGFRISSTMQIQLRGRPNVVVG